jgi:phosphoglycerol transferase MdoB-like AlkP superfamily enzyme
MDRAAVYQTQWRALSEILGAAGYRSLFIHGRDLEFDQMREFLGMIHFNTIIDRRNFPSKYHEEHGSWQGYNDEDVMRRAEEEFAAQKQPFLGVIYPMNTHPPFMTPKDFPLAYPDGSSSSRFLNSLKYTDYALQVFFDLARQQPYFKDTVFVLVADHARTRDQFNLSNQHHIPLIIYAPGSVKPGRNPVVGSQIDIMPTIVGLLQLKTTYAAWGRNLLAVPRDQGFAVSVVGNDVRWHDSHYLLSDSLGEHEPLMFDTTTDPDCTRDIWEQNKAAGEAIKARLRAYVSLSETLLCDNRVYPGKPQPVVANK